MADEPARWRLIFHEAARPELDRIKERPDQMQAVLHVMKLLALEVDPRKPQNPALSVCAIRYDAPGWFRVKTLKFNMRIVFRILQRSGEIVYELHDGDPMFEPVDSQAIQITQASPRRDAYGFGLKERFLSVISGRAKQAP